MNLLRHRMDLALRFSKGKGLTYFSKFLTEQLNNLDRILKGERYLAVTYYVPGELMALFDVPVLYIERIAGFAAANRMFQDLDKMRNKLSFPACGCSYQLIFECLVEEKLLPPPAAYIASNFACDDAWMYCYSRAVKKGLPFFMLDVLHGNKRTSANYFQGQLYKLYQDLKLQFKQIRSISEVSEIANETVILKSRIDILRKQYPGIIESSNIYKIFTLYNDLGKPMTLNIFQDIIKGVEDKTSNYKPEKCNKIIWLGIIPLFQNNILIETEKRYNCQFVYEDLFDYPKNIIHKDFFFRDISYRIFNSVFYSLTNRIEAIKEVDNRMGIDAVIHFSQRNCRFLPPLFPKIKRKMDDRAIPSIEIKGDAIDPNWFDVKEYWKGMDELFLAIGDKEDD